MLNFQVLKSNITQKRWQESETLKESELEDDDILFAIQSFAFTANNVTYADLGKVLSTGNFFLLMMNGEVFHAGVLLKFNFQNQLKFKLVQFIMVFFRWLLT